MTEHALDLDAVRKRADAATRGPWKTGNRFGNRSLGSSVVVLAGNLPPVELDPHRNGRNDAAFIAHARTDVPALLAEINRLHEQLGAVEALEARWREREALLPPRRRGHADELAAALKGIQG